WPQREEYAHSVAARLEPLGVVEVRRQEFALPAAPPSRPLGDGPFRVRLLAYPAERRLLLLLALVGSLRMTIPQAQALADSPPITLADGADANGARRLSLQFAHFGTVEVVPADD